MPFNGSDVYSPPSPEFPAIPNTTIESADFNAIINDIASALTTVGGDLSTAEAIIASLGKVARIATSPIYNVEDYCTCDGVTDITTSFQSLITTVAAGLDSVADGYKAATIMCHSPFVISNKITVPMKHRLNLILNCTVKAATWSGATTDPMFELNCQSSYIAIQKLDCNHLCSGIENKQYGNTNCNSFVVHYVDFGIHHNVYSASVDNSGNNLYINVKAHQHLSADTLFDTPANFTADGLRITGVDSKFIGCNFAWSGKPVNIKSNASFNWLIGCHIWNGAPPEEVAVTALTPGTSYVISTAGTTDFTLIGAANSTVGTIFTASGVGTGTGKVSLASRLQTNPTIIYNESGSGRNFIQSCYLDNGRVEDRTGNLQIIDCNYLNLAQNVILQHPYIKVYRDGSTVNPNKSNIKGTKASISFEAGTAGSWDGDYTTINAILGSADTDGTELTVRKRNYHIYPYYGTDINHEKYLCPGGNIAWSFNVGTYATQYMIANGTEFRFETPEFRITTISPGTVPHRLWLGGGVVGISEESSGELSFGCAAGYTWKVGSLGSLKPTAHNTYDIGAATEAVQYAFFKSIFCSNLTGDGEAFIRGNLGSNSGIYFREATTNGGTTYNERGGIGYDATRAKAFWRHNSPTGPLWTNCVGSPEGAVTAPVGSLCTRTDGGANTTLYVKESGSGNTGWVAK